MKKAVFIFRCPLKIIELNNFFRHKNILLNYDNINNKLDEFKFQIASVFLKAINPYLVQRVKINIQDDQIYFFTTPLPYIISGDQYVIAGKVPYMATPVVTQIDKESKDYILELAEDTNSMFAM